MNIFTLSDENDLSDKISLDDLFETKREYDENKLNLFESETNSLKSELDI